MFKLGAIVSSVRSGHTYLDQADDMGALAKLFRDNWASAKGRCDVTEQEVVQALSLGARFLEAVGQVNVDAISEQKELRSIAGEYLRRGVEQIQAAAQFLFSENEKQLSRYPSLAVMKRRRKTDQPEDESEIIPTDDSTDITIEPPPPEPSPAEIATATTAE